MDADDCPVLKISYAKVRLVGTPESQNTLELLGVSGVESAVESYRHAHVLDR
jgi:hypothetical protein